MGRRSEAVRASDRGHRADAGRPVVAVSLRGRVLAARSAIRVDRRIGRHGRIAGRAAPALLLSLRPRNGPLRLRRHARDSLRRRVDRPRARRIHLGHGTPRARAGDFAPVMPPLFPERASTMATRVDALYFFLLALAVFFSLLIAGVIVYFAVKSRPRSPESVGAHIYGGLGLEVTWTVVPLLITMVIFVWGASVYFAMATPPEDTLNIYVVGKQWMWKFQHLDGQREIDELHVPSGRNVKLITTSEDVIHDFFVPAFRMKADVLPGRYVSLWFHPTKPGRYHILCAEYCGTRHSGMTGEVVVMEP